MKRIPTTEKRLWQILKQEMPAVHWTRIETGVTKRGVPDIEGCWRGQTCWIELKIVRQGKIALTPLQAAWHTQRYNAGGVSWILATDPAQDALILWDGADAQDLCLGRPITPYCTYPWSDTDTQAFWGNFKRALF